MNISSLMFALVIMVGAQSVYADTQCKSETAGVCNPKAEGMPDLGKGMEDVQKISDLAQKSDRRCSELLNAPDEIEFVGAMGKLGEQIRKGEASLEEVQAELKKSREDILANKSGLSEQEKSDLLKMLSGMEAGFLKNEAQRLYGEALMDRVVGGASRPTLQKSLNSLGMNKLDDAFERDLPAMKFNYDILGQNGAKYDAGKGWDFSKYNFTNLDSNQLLALMQAFPQAPVQELKNPNRKVAIALGDQVILPPSAGKNVEVLSTKEYDSELSKGFDSVKDEMQNYLAFSKSDSGFLKNFWRNFRQSGDVGVNSPEYKKATAHVNAANGKFKKLNERLGLNPNMRRTISDMISETTQRGGQYYNNLANAMDKAILGSYLAMAGVAVGPAVGALGGAAMATEGSLAVAAHAGASAGLKGALMMTAMPIKFGALGSEITAISRWANQGGDIFCHLADAFDEMLPEAILGAGAFSLLPSAPFMVAGATRLKWGAEAAQLGSQATGIATGLGFTAMMGYGARTKGKASYDLFAQAKAALEKGDEKLAASLNAQAWDLLIGAGIDAGFALHGGLALKKTYDSARTVMGPGEKGMDRSEALKILGLSENATEKEIRSAYWKKAKEFHPDLPENKGKSPDGFLKAKTAYEALKNNPQKGGTTAPVVRPEEVVTEADRIALETSLQTTKDGKVVLEAFKKPEDRTILVKMDRALAKIYPDPIKRAVEMLKRTRACMR